MFACLPTFSDCYFFIAVARSLARFLTSFWARNLWKYLISPMILLKTRGYKQLITQNNFSELGFLVFWPLGAGICYFLLQIRIIHAKLYTLCAGKLWQSGIWWKWFEYLSMFGTMKERNRGKACRKVHWTGTHRKLLGLNMKSWYEITRLPRHLLVFPVFCCPRMPLG